MEQLRDFDSARLEEEKRRLQLVMLIVLAVFGLLTLRLWYMQAVMGASYRKMSEHNRVRIRDIPPCRGLIYDRNGLVLVDNRPCFDLCLVPEEAADPATVLRQLAAISGTPAGELEARLAAASGKPPFQPVLLVADAGRDLVAQVEMHRFDLPGVTIEVRPKRNYLYPELAPHLLGYLGEADQRDLAADGRLASGDFVGKYGIELASQPVLAGLHGRRRVEVDACGREIRALGEIKPAYGRSIRLTIDFALQRVAQKALAGKAGAILAMDVESGELLALASAPAFDPNGFIVGFKPEVWEGLREDPRHPLHNRAVQGAYPPGSTYKVIVALAGLEEGVITPQTTVECPGYYYYRGRTCRCWKWGGHGTVNLRRAVVESCDVFFYRLGEKLGIDRLAAYGAAFGLGSPAGLGLGTEASGIVPSREWKLKRLGKSWLPGETLSAAIGQGFNTTTPLQMLAVYAAVANGGRLVRPQLVEGTEGQDGRLRSTLCPETLGRLPVSERSLGLVRAALSGVVSDENGTGKAARSELVSVAGKTGTAQVVRLPRRLPPGMELPEEWRDHAWFIAFAPADEPRLSVAVLIEHGGHGGSAAAPLARKLIEEAARRGYLAAPELAPPRPPVKSGRLEAAASPRRQ